MTYTKCQALAVARAIKAGSRVPGRIYIFGSSAHGGGKDIDVIVEVPAPLFSRYQEACDFSGVSAIVRGVFDRQDLFWAYFSPVEKRSEAALDVIGVRHEWILGTDGMSIPCRDLDVICLPTGWNTSPLLEQLQAEMSANWKCDPKFMRNLSQSAILVE